MDKDTVIRVAYAEDHVSVRKGIIKFIQELGGISVDIQADNGLQMLEKLSEASELPDVCIIDINMPEMDGFSLLMAIRKRWPDMRTLILTKYDNDAYIIKMIQNGANGYLQKSCEPEEIKLALESIYHTGYYYSAVADMDKFDAANNKKRKPFNITEVEHEFLTYVCADLSYDQIAEKMKKSTASVKGYRDRVCRKLGVSGRVALAIYAIQTGIVVLDIPNQLKYKR